MGQPYVGEIRMFAGNYAPAGWAFCNGSLLPISENEALFQLIGTSYGGDGQQTFAVPDLQGRVPIHQGNGVVMAETGGAEEVTLTTQQIPSHSHAFLANSSAATARGPVPGLMLSSASANIYTDQASPVALNPQAVTNTGGNQPHSNMQPFLCVSFIISLYGIFPSPS